MKDNRNFPYITLRRIGVYAICIVAVEVTFFMYSLYDKNSQNSDANSHTLLLIPLCGIWITFTKYLTYNLWYISRIRRTGVAYKANVLRTNKGGIDPTAPFASEVKHYNVTYVPQTSLHLLFRFVLSLLLLFSQVLGLCVLLLGLYYSGLVSFN